MIQLRDSLTGNLLFSFSGEELCLRPDTVGAKTSPAELEGLLGVLGKVVLAYRETAFVTRFRVHTLIITKADPLEILVYGYPV